MRAVCSDEIRETANGSASHSAHFYSETVNGKYRQRASFTIWIQCDIQEHPLPTVSNFIVRRWQWGRKSFTKFRSENICVLFWNRFDPSMKSFSGELKWNSYSYILDVIRAIGRRKIFCGSIHCGCVLKSIVLYFSSHILLRVSALASDIVSHRIKPAPANSINC